MQLLQQEAPKSRAQIVPEQSAPNRTGIPLAMKQRFEEASGFSLDDVRIHYNSEKPAALGALAYTQGAQVHIGPGQERHLPHELGHVIQQKQGIVRPTGRIGGLPVNFDPALERRPTAWNRYPRSGRAARPSPMWRSVSFP